MALVSCVECGRQISDQAPACPGCGMPRQTRAEDSPPAPPPSDIPAAWREPPPPPKPPAERSSNSYGWLIAVGVVFVLLVVAKCTDTNTPAKRSAAASGGAGATAAAEGGRESDRYRSQLAKEMRDEGRNASARLMAAKSLMSSHPGSAEASEAQTMLPILEELYRTENIGKQWAYTRAQDAMSGKASVQASVRSRNSFNLDFPYSGPQHATLVVRSHPRWGRDVIFRIERGQILCSSYSDCTVRVRFDDEAPRTLHGNEPADNSTEVVFLPGYADLVRRIGKAKVMRVEVTLHQQGPLVAEFDVEGFDPARLK